jgi:hypothetical protein
MASDDFACLHFGVIQYSMEQLHLGVVSEMDRLANKVEIWVFFTIYSAEHLSHACLAPYEAKSSGG